MASLKVLLTRRTDFVLHGITSHEGLTYLATIAHCRSYDVGVGVKWGQISRFGASLYRGAYGSWDLDITRFTNVALIRKTARLLNEDDPFHNDVCRTYHESSTFWVGIVSRCFTSEPESLPQN